MSWVFEEFAEIGIGVAAILGLSVLVRFLWFRRRALPIQSNRARVMRIVNHTLLVSLAISPSAFAVYFYFMRPSPEIGLAEIRLSRSYAATMMFIHGWPGVGTTTWLEFPRLVAADPRFAKYNILVASYPSYLVGKNVHIAHVADHLRQQLRQKVATGPVFIVAHSMGGVIARQLIMQDRLSGAPLGVRALVSISSPFLGANIARLGLALGITPDHLGDLRPNSSFLSQQALGWAALSQDMKALSAVRSLCIGSEIDDVVPKRSAQDQCADRETLSEWDHIHIARPSRVDDKRYTVPMDWVAAVAKVWD